MRVNIEIDSLTPCLIERKTGKITKTKHIIAEKKDVKNLKWNFNWTTPFDTGFTVVALKAYDSDEIEGLIAYKVIEDSQTVLVDIVENAPHNIGSKGKYDGVGSHLFAIAINESYANGFDGHIYFVAKSNLINYYIEKLKAQLVNPKLYTMEISGLNSKRLHDIYFGGIDNDENNN